MKKVFYLISLSVFFVYTSQAQDLVANNTATITKVSASDNTNKAIFDYTAVEQIRAHIISDKKLSGYLDLYGPVPKMKVEVSVNSKGFITGTEVIEGGYGEHAILLKKSVERLKKVTPIKIDGINVNQKVVIPVSFI